MGIFAVVDPAGNIVNRVVIDNPAEWTAPTGCAVVAEIDVPLEIGGTYLNGVYTAPPSPPSAPSPQYVLPQDLMAQLTIADATAIQSAVSANIRFWLLWESMQAQRDPMLVTNDRFLAGWAALVQVLGSDRMGVIASALGIKV